MKLPKGWIRVNALAYETKEDKQMESLGIETGRDHFTEEYVQVSCITAVSYDHIDEENCLYLNNGRTWVIKETPEQLLQLVEADRLRVD